MQKALWMGAPTVCGGKEPKNLFVKGLPPLFLRGETGRISQSQNRVLFARNFMKRLLQQVLVHLL